MKPFHESMRYEYNLTPDSMVFDVGGYQGAFAREIHKRYGCWVQCYEPVFYENLRESLADLIPYVEVFKYGLSDSDRAVTMRVKGDSTGQFADSGKEVVAFMEDATNVITYSIQLLKINAEGGEFAILEAILDRGNPRLIENLQVQPHPIVPDYEARWQRIHERLLETHELVYHAPWCWSGYTLK